eukprot:TRINITY_DN190_c0_g1_i1.p1 TRINITY_DN190_c0_g1~~TRINITY_DN190_c0_g1_i1.p1  ORF type:complete len:175 (-),score=9.92 TRINITY_DN190_c0_g1_i1:279-803(-)
MFYPAIRPIQQIAPLPHKGVMTLFTALTGGISAMIGIGGGALLVPLLTYFSLDMKKAIGCASACGIVIALFGSIGYISSGSAHFALADGFAGFVYLPALLGIVSTSWFTAPLGAKAANTLPVPFIKKYSLGYCSPWRSVCCLTNKLRLHINGSTLAFHEHCHDSKYLHINLNFA